MFVQTVLTLIKLLKSDEKLLESDRDFCEKLEKQIANRNVLDHLTEEEVAFVVSYYKERWHYVVGVDNEHKLRSQHANPCWIDFVNTLNESVIIVRENTVHPCWPVILSLLTTHFDVYAINSKTIHLWDKHNTVFPEAARMYEALFPLIQSNDREQVECMYDKLIETIIIPANKDDSFMTTRTRYESTTKWLMCVENGTLSKNGPYWYESEVFLMALLNYKSEYVEVNNKIKMFLDKLIQTYAQDKDELMKLLRINLIFNDMIKGLKLCIKEDILINIDKYERLGNKENFINNSIDFINKRLLEVGFVHYKDTNHFFNIPLQNEKLPITLCSGSLDHLGDVIDAFKKVLNSLEGAINQIAYKRIVDYLTELSRPILSDSEKEGAVVSQGMRDYFLGSQT